MGFNSARAISVKINGTRIASVDKVETVYQRERAITDGKLNVNLKTIDVKITRKRRLEDAFSDGVEFRPLKAFTLTVSFPHYDTSYDNCEWVDYKETLGEDDTIIEEMTVASLSYKFVTS